MPKHPDFGRQPYRRQREDYRQALIQRYGAMVAVHNAMLPEEKRHLDAWESEFVMGRIRYERLAGLGEMH